MRSRWNTATARLVALPLILSCLALSALAQAQPPHHEPVGSSGAAAVPAAPRAQTPNERFNVEPTRTGTPPSGQAPPSSTTSSSRSLKKVTQPLSEPSCI